MQSKLYFNLIKNNNNNLVTVSDLFEKFFSPKKKQKKTYLRSLVGIAFLMSGEW